MPAAPTVIHPLSLSGLLGHLLATQFDAVAAATAATAATAANTTTITASTVLVVCSSRSVFLHHLAASLQQQQQQQQNQHDDHNNNKNQELDYLQKASEPTLHNLLVARSLKLAFCASVQALLAYLATHHRLETLFAGSTPTRRLVLVNLVALHASTPSFSAQGLSRTFASAVETALKIGAVLYVVECTGEPSSARQHGQMYEDGEMETRCEQGQGRVDEGDPWEQHVPILNLSPRRFGSGAGERGWAGRTVKVKGIASRWFRFHTLEEESAEAHEANRIACQQT